MITVAAPPMEDDMQVLETLVGEVLGLLGDDPLREGLLETPHRVAKAWLEEIFSGYRADPMEVMKTFEEETTGDLVVVKDIPVYSSCEHHMEPIIGLAHIAYIPNGKILGLSKFARLVEIFARRLQVQERLTLQVAESLMEGLQPKGVMVVISARHLCMERRGVQAYGSYTVTSAIRGIFEDDQALRSEALSFIRPQ